ncbi:MAG: flagellar biosynthesis protein FlhB [Cellvibrionaceae bacterium]|nr:flagellar biosynthesis protein FlhB [Cellvibrionaceae bacterium]
MAENDDSAQEKTEEATPRRQEKAREEGQIPRSRDLTTSAVLILGAVGLWIFGGRMAETLMNVLRFNFTVEREVIFDPQKMFAQLGSSFFDALWSLIPLFSILLVAAIVGPIILGGFLFSGKSIAPKLSRIDPLAGLKRMFSLKSLVELGKSIGKVVVVVAVAYFTLRMFEPELLGLSRESLENGVQHSLRISLWATLLISCSTILIAAIDVPFQIWEHAKNLKMSRQDIKDEMKDSEGKPEVKGRIRQLQREMANRRMMASVPKADVIITNPTHYAVALKYDPETMATPILLAKGVDETAMKIREIAREYKIEQVRTPVLARAIYHTTDIDSEIPQGLYLAVAQVLAYVFQLRNFRKGRGERPDFPGNIKVPKDMIFPEKS